MSVQQTVEINSIATVLQELRPLIEDVQRTLEEDLASNEPTARMGESATRLREIAGTLQLLDLHGPAALAQEMHVLAEALGEARVEAVETALDRMLRAVFRLPDYLDRIQAGQRDMPLVLLPLVNELRSARGEQALSEQALFLPDLASHFPVDEDVDDGGELQAVARRQRHSFMKAFLNWYRGVDPEAALAEIERVTHELAEAARRRGVQRLWQAGAAIAESLHDDDERTAVNARRLLVRLERLLSRFVREGEAAVAPSMPAEFLRDLLYHIAHSESAGETVVGVKRFHRLDELLASGQEAAGFEGPNRELLEAVGEGIRADLNEVKNAIEIFVHGEDHDPEVLEGLPQQLNRIADTFSMIGLSDVHDTLAGEAEALSKLDPSAADAESRLQRLADMLLRADNDLVAMQSGRPVVDPDAIEVEDTEALAIRHLPDSEYYPLVSALVTASLDDLSRVREAVGAYCADPESGTAAVGEVPTLLSEVSGALRILPLDEALPILRGLQDYVERELVQRRHRPDDQAQILIADVVAGVEYYLEAVEHDRIGMTHLLESANRAVAALQSGRAPAQYEGDEEVVIDSAQLPSEDGSYTVDEADLAEGAPDDAGSADAATSGRGETGGGTAPGAPETAGSRDTGGPPSSAPPAAPGIDPAASGSAELAILGEEVDQEIVEVFIEEALGELDKINEHLRTWRAAPRDEESLIVIRRAYHTLKGGGRLIGAELIGEFSWSMENMLNRVIDHTIDPTTPVFDTLEEASAALPQLIEQLQGNRTPIEGVDDLIARAHALSRGEEPPPGGGGGGADDSEPPDAPAGGDGETETRPSEPEVSDVDAAGDSGQQAGSRSADAGGHTDTEDASKPAREAAPPAAPPATASAGDASAAGEGEDYREELLKIFADEAEGYCRQLRERFEAPGGGAELTVDEDTRRVLHTLVGSAQTAQVAAMGDVAALLEDLAKVQREQDFRLPAPAAELFREAVARLDAMLADTRSGREPDAGDLVQRLRGARDELAGAVAAEPGDAGDPELLEVFLEEADEILEACDQNVARWRDDPADREALSELQRALHTLKGGARMSSLPAIADLTHETESLIEAVVDGSVEHGDEALDLVQEAVDSLTVLLEHARNRQPLAPVDWLVKDLHKLRVGASADGEPAAGTSAETAPAADDDEPTPPEAPAAGTAEAEPADEAAAGDPPTQRPGTSDQIRVQAELLDSLVNFAGEVSIYHSRLGEQMTQYRFNLNEFQQTVNRVREQLRTMENETESQILYRNQKEADRPDQQWDPLEFDRYTRIQEMSRSLAESIGDLDSIKDILDNLTRDAETLLLQQSRVSSDLQNGLMQTRMVRFDGLRARLNRIVRQTASSLHKQAQLTMTGGELEIDRSVQERVIAPLEHILRNAVSHGIERPGKRRELGKPDQGTIRLDLHRGGSDIIIDITDDGAGIDPQRVRRKGIEKGLISADDDMDDNEVIKLILETGFSTADEVTQISGRGVGMDVVDAEIRRLGGTLGIQTGLGVGTKFTVRLPVTLAINQAVLVGAGDVQYAIPIASIEGVAQVTAGELKAHYVDPSRLYHYGGNEYKVRHLGSLLGVSEPRLDDEEISWPVVMIRAADERAALHVDALLGRREVVVKPVGAPVNTLPAISGATIMPDGEVVLILDMGGLLGTEHRFVATGIERDQFVDSGEDDESEEQAPTVLVVDDSITIRKVTQRILDRNGIHVETAKDGVDAVAYMGENVPDLILLDIEMPRMDGYEVANFVRGDERLAKVPIIMITSRTGQKHRQRAENIGVDRYLGKPYQESELMEHINALLRTPA